MRSPLKSLLSWLLPLLLILGVFFALQQWQKNRDDGPSFPESPPALTPNFPDSTPQEITEEIFEAEESTDEPQKSKPQEDQKVMASAVKMGKVETCGDIGGQTMREECEDNLNYPQFIQQGNTSQCQTLHSPTLQQDCLDTLSYQKAIEAKNRKQCEIIKSEGLQNRCLDELNLILNQTGQSLEGCDAIENLNQKIRCEDQEKMGQAIRQGDVSECEKIQNQTLKNQCLNTIESNQNQAQAIQAAQEKQTDDTSLILDQNDPLKQCELLINEAKQSCEDEIYFDLAFEEKNLIYCNQVVDSKKQERCRSEQQAAIDQYYLKVATSKSECQLISNEELEELCIKNFK